MSEDAINDRSPSPSSLQIARIALIEIQDRVRRALDNDYSSSESGENSPLPNNVVRARQFPFELNDYNLLAQHDTPTTSRDGSVFDYTDVYRDLLNEMANNPIDATTHIPIEDVDQEIQRLRQSPQMNVNREAIVNERAINEPQIAEETLLQELIRDNAELRRQLARLTRNESNPPVGNSRNLAPLNLTLPMDVTYGRTRFDVRNQPGTSMNFLTLKEARSMIPEIDGTSRQSIRQFLTTSTFVMKNIHPADETILLETIICTKFRGKAMTDFHTREIRNFEQLKHELEKEYLGKRGTAYLQLEFNSLKQKQTESAQAFGHRVEKLALELYESTEEGKNHTLEQQQAILEIIKEQALHNYQVGLNDDIKLLVRSQRYTTLQEAIAGANAEEKVKNPQVKNFYSNRSKHDASNSSRQTTHEIIKCMKCGKLGHYGRDCRSSRYATRFSLPKPEGRANVNTVNKYCNYCKKTGHTRQECWSLNGRPGKDQKYQTKREAGKKKQVNTTEKVRRSKKRHESDGSSYSSSESEEERRATKTTRAARAHQVTQVIAKQRASTGLKLVTIPVEEAKKGKMNFLFDSGATLTLIKVGNLDGDTPIRDKRMALTGVTGHQMYTIGKMRATIVLGNRKIRHTMHVVKDDFPMDYQGILGIDFLEKHGAKCDLQKKQLRIGNAVLTLHSAEKLRLTPRSETIVTAVTDKNQLGIITSEETKPGVFIGSCLVEPEKHACPVSIINTTEEIVEIITPFVTLDEMQVSDTASMHTVTTAHNGNTESIHTRRKRLREQLRTEHLNIEERKTLHEICDDFCDTFHLEDDILTCTTAVEHEITTRTDSAPVNVRPYRLPPKHKEEVNRQIKKMLDEEIIRHSTSQWNAPLLVVPKKSDASGKLKWRIVVDFRKLNDLTIGDSFPLPNITDILDQLGNAKYFSTLDLASGYHQIPMSKEHQQKTAFSTPYGHYEFNRMPFGLKNAPATFQRLMNSVLTGIQGLKCLVYLDDIVIYGSDLREHNKRLVEVLQRLRGKNLKLQPDKCEFLRKEVTYLGHIITESGIRPDPNKLRAVKEFPTPKRIKDIQSFLGLAGYYRKFIEDFSKVARPLSNLTKKGVKFSWEIEQQNAFEALKEKLTTAPVLNYPDFTREFLVTTDASDYAIGAVLSQGAVGQDRPIAYASRTLNKAERNYNTTEKELLAIVWAVKYFRPYIYGTKFTIVTDHRPLVWLFSVTDPGSRLIRWRLKLEEYDYTIVHKAGKGNSNADALSRNPIQGDAQVNGIRRSERIREEEEEEEDTKEEEIREYTAEEKRQILYEYHDAPIGGHQGIARTLKRIRLAHNWRGITKDIEEYIGKCEYCQKNKLSRKTKMPLVITDTPKKPFEKCALDIVGPLPVTTTGNKYILTFQDSLTKFSKAIPIANQEAATVAKAFVTKVVVEHGIPEMILTDQGTNFTSELFKNTCKLLRIEKVQTTAYHPESNGALERSHRTLAEYLRHYIEEEQTDWDEWLPYAMFAYNTTPHTTTGYTPFELVYGHQASLPTALTKPPKLTYSYDDYAQELRERIRATNQVAKENTKQAKIQAKIQYDKAVKKELFKVGDKVLLYDETVRRGRSKKLESKWIGPYIITEKHSDVNYTVKMGRRKMRVHANRLKNFIEA